MRYALLTSLGGELIEANNADYETYKGFLKCPNCKEPVFLRKFHYRGDLKIQSSFVHHKAVPEISTCELRIGKYSQNDIEKIASIARGQRVKKLEISLWKFLKRNLTLDLRAWSIYIKQMKQFEMTRELMRWGVELIEINVDFITNDTLYRVQELLFSRDARIAIIPERKVIFDKFLDENKSDWKLHCKIASEALELFAKSQYFKKIRSRLVACLAHPNSLQALPELLDLDSATDEWREKFVSYLTLQITFVFLTVDWVTVFSE